MTVPKTLHELKTERQNQYLEKAISNKRILLDRIRDERKVQKYLKSMEL